MRRLIMLGALLLIAALLPTQAASAQPRVGPPLQLQLYLDVMAGVDGSDVAELYVAGRGCLPEDAPASVMVTVDRLAGQVFTAKPNVNGRWSVDITIPTPIDGVYVVNATCDNYFGTTVYPTAQTDADHVIIAVAAGAGGSSNGSAGGTVPPEPTVITDPACAAFGVNCVSDTGSDTAAEVGLGLGALLLGSLLVLIGRPRRVSRH